jgi:hypothetical protein
MIDTGIETAHPDLQQNFRSHLSYDFSHFDNDVDERAPNLLDDNDPRELVHTVGDRDISNVDYPLEFGTAPEIVRSRVRALIVV